jgi:hypothetical protein
MRPRLFIEEHLGVVVAQVLGGGNKKASGAAGRRCCIE